jgi:isoquinoline 1-oxidoreductase beta subunit
MSTLNVIIENVSRRGFLKGMLATSGLVLAAEFLPARGALAYATGADKMPHGVITDPHVFVSIEPNGLVSIIAHRAEMGTGSRTSLPMVLADELEADWTRVRVVQAPGDEEKYGNQDTDGSRSLRHHLQPMRQMGASARHMLEAAAAKRWGVALGDVEARNHEVVHKASGRKLGYGELAADAAATHTRRRSDQAQGPGGIPLYRQRQYADRRSLRHHHRTRGLRHRREAAGDEVRGDRATAGVRRQGCLP